MATRTEPANQDYQALTEKEKQTLRLLLAGHDAKSIARHFGLSVHTINERLRDARRKLSASSSREAARLLREAEGPQKLGDEGIGGAATVRTAPKAGEPKEGSFAKGRAVWAIGGFAMISLIAALLASSGALEPAQGPAASPGHASAPSRAAESAVTESARSWLALVDAGKWPESWAATGQSFQSLNTVEAWRSASASARVPLGRVLSRSLAGEESVPAPPHGYQLVRFRTDFAGKAGAVETLSLVREGESWKVVGYIID